MVGLVPLAAMIKSGQWYAPKDCEDENELVQAAINGLGLSKLSPFVPEQRIIEWALKQEDLE